MFEEVEVLKRVHISLNVTVAGLLILLGAILCGLYVMYPQYKDILIFVGAVITGVSGIYSAYYVGKTLRVQVHQRAVDNSFKLIEKLNDSDYMTVLSFVDQNIKHQEIPPSKLYATICAD